MFEGRGAATEHALVPMLVLTVGTEQSQRWAVEDGQYFIAVRSQECRHVGYLHALDIMINSTNLKYTILDSSVYILIF